MHCWEGRAAGEVCIGRRDGEGNKRRLTLPTFVRGHLTVGPLRGRGPRPLFPFPGPFLRATLFGTPTRAQSSRPALLHLSRYTSIRQACILYDTDCTLPHRCSGATVQYHATRLSVAPSSRSCTVVLYNALPRFSPIWYTGTLAHSKRASELQHLARCILGLNPKITPTEAVLETFA